MNKIGEQMMLQQLKSVYWLMMDSSGKMDFENKTLWDEIIDLDQDSGDYQEVVVEIYFTDGRFIKLHNRSFESLLNGTYSGDDIYLLHMDDEKLFQAVVECGACTYDIYLPMARIRYNDPETGRTETEFPISSVVRIACYHKKVKWSEEWAKLSPEKVKLHERVFRNFREKYLRDHPEIKE